jgi:membrane protease YdiL (CAAX protease family)
LFSNGTPGSSTVFDLAEGHAVSTARASLLAYVGAIAAGEAVLVFVSVEAGLVLDALLLGILVNHHTFASHLEERARQALLVLALIPLARVASFVLPQSTLQALYWEALIVGAILLGIVSTRGLVDPTWLQLGRGRCSPWIQGAVALTGIPLSLGLVGSGLERGVGEVESASVTLQAILILFASGIAIELLCRGLVQSALTSIFGRLGIGLAAGTFAVLFLGTRSITYVVLAGALGLAYGVVVDRTGSVVGVALSHGVLNIGWTVIWPRVV